MIIKILTWLSITLVGVLAAVYEFMSHQIEKQDKEIDKNKVEAIHDEAKKAVDSESLKHLVDDTNSRYLGKSSSGDSK